MTIILSKTKHNIDYDVWIQTTYGDDDHFCIVNAE